MKRSTKNPNLWLRRTAAARCFTLVFVFTYITISDLTNHMTEAATYKKTSTNSKFITCNEDFTKSKFCLSPECMHTASAVLSKMKREVQPCDDFYQFACGNFIDETQIPENKAESHITSNLNDQVQEQMKKIIEEDRPEADPQFLKLPNALYKACMNTTLIESLGAKPMQRLAEILGGWPVLEGDSWDYHNTWTWQDTIAKFRHSGFPINFLFHFSINPNLKDNTEHIIYLKLKINVEKNNQLANQEYLMNKYALVRYQGILIHQLDQPKFGLDREYLVKGFNEPLVSDYYDYMVNISEGFGADRKTAAKQLKESVEFEIQMAKISLPSEKRRNPNELYNLRNIKQLQKDYPYVKWLDFINSLLPNGHSVDENEVVNVMVPSFFENLGKLLKRTIESSGKRTIANYLMKRAHAFSIFFLSKEFRKIQYQYFNTLLGIEKEEPRWTECVYLASGSKNKLRAVGGNLYVRKHFNESSKSVALEIVNNIRNAFSQILNEVEWMDDETKRLAQIKLFSMNTQIGYPDELLDDDKLKQLYTNFDIDSGKYFDSALKLFVAEMDDSFSKLREPWKNTEWIKKSRPSDVNAYYNMLENTLDFPAGILQGHFFNSHRPMYMNYGAIGSTIGHEITHGFDDRGSHFNHQGKLINWWQPDTKKAYLEKVKCIVEQYGNYTEKQTGLNINGITTQGENIADNGGIKESYLAYKRWEDKNGEERKLPGLDYTPRQMFWISAAQTWCAKYTKEHLKMMITTAAHLPGEFRVLGPLRNIKDFSRDFQCPEGTPMNPVNKCQVW